MADEKKRTITDALNELVNNDPNGLKPQINNKLDKDGTAKAAEKLTGEPTAPTPAEGDSSTRVATTAFVNNLVSKLLSFADEDLNTFVEIVENIKTLRNSKATSSEFGLVKVGSNITVVDGTISLTENNVVNALGYTPSQTGGSSVTLENGTGSSTTKGMTQAAITTELNDKLSTKGKAASATVADSASKVTGGTIQLTGSVTGSGSFNSSGNVTISTSGGGTTYSTGTATTAGLTKLYTSTGTAADGTMTQNAINTALNGKLGTSATATAAQKVTGGTVTISGAVTGSGSFGSAGNVTIATSPVVNSIFSAVDQDSSINLNKLTQLGFHRISATSSTQNAPDTGTLYIMIIGGANRTSRIQIAFKFNGQKFWIRGSEDVTVATPTWSYWRTTELTTA